MKLRLYHYWRSSSSWRVRWALAFKNIDCEFVPVNLLDDETERPEHLARNPMGYVPVLELMAPEAPFQFLTESVAILEWLEEVFPSPGLLPKDPYLRAKVRQLCEIINAGTQPLQNPNVAAFHSPDPEEQKRWNQHWIRKGLDSFEKLIEGSSGRFCVGNELTLADLFLVPQCYNAGRQGVTLDRYPRIERAIKEALETESCKRSHPDRFQPK